jgi:hypothetical protein
MCAAAHTLCGMAKKSGAGTLSPAHQKTKLRVSATKQYS